ncbi:phosphopentomutase [Desulfofarcimen acetoxidans DSM 771]|uniref:Phosphopentomutase n=1 Tax=Desulfofarcimen acetoxidans (strain ATCC 49208 / DSM 771 / KCTC 5769 / VKM B-1644 / 5575) TaxID=485916 RepID=C8VYX2_DESAS|nr:phosphopentomutase [Desulfofarcimen acetoxidans DSM 771]
MHRRVLLIVLDSVGIGELSDAGLYGDNGSNTLANIAQAVNGLNLPNLAAMGLGNIADIQGVLPAALPSGAYGKMAEKSKGKDTTTGHWELAGLILEKAFPVYPQGFPPEIINEFERLIGRPVLGNKVASGTEIIEELGEEHMKTGYPIVYTSADSVFQIAAHEETIRLDELYRMCKTARNLLTGEHAVGRVIARPFIGQPGSFERTANRHDYSLKPPRKTILNLLNEKGIIVTGVGKIHDIFAGEGINRSIHIEGNMDGVDKIIDLLGEDSSGLIFANLVDFDSKYGHRNDPKGYAAALEAFDSRLPEITSRMRKSDILIITADHGCDPTTKGTDHTREFIPLLVFGQDIKSVNLGVRACFSDMAATLGELWDIKYPEGKSFWQELRKEGAQSDENV